MSKPDTTKTFVDKYEDEIKKYFINNLINKEIISEIPKEKYEKIFKDIIERKPELYVKRFIIIIFMKNIISICNRN